MSFKQEIWLRAERRADGTFQLATTYGGSAYRLYYKEWRKCGLYGGVSTVPPRIAAELDKGHMVFVDFEDGVFVSADCGAAE